MKLSMEEARRKADGEEVEGKTVVVGMKMETGSRELLTWALVKVANAGDRVVALHVLPSAAEVPDSDGKPSSLISLVKVFDAVLGVYEGFCNLKQIDLKLKICRGCSIRKILVKEASSVSASKLILGVAKNSHVIGSSSTSVAKYCAKNLSPGCLVLAVNNGKIIFQREATGNKSTHDLLLKCDFEKLQKINGHSAKNANLSRPSFHHRLTKSGEKSSFDRKESNATKISSLDALEKKECPVHEPVCKPSCSPAARGKDHTTSDPEKGRSLALVPVKEHESSLGCISVLIRELPDGRPSWPLLRRAVLNHKRSSSQEKSKSSVVQWPIMRIPGRYSVSSMVHPDRKQARSDAAVKTSFDGEVGAIVPMNLTSEVEANDEEKELPKELLSLQETYSSVCRLFSYKELVQATSNFSPANIIGKGGSSKVYKGCLSDGKELAVKILKPSEVVLKDFISEIEIITNLHHKNVISLFGFCFENNNLILVYNMLPRGSLEDNLHGIKGDKNDLGWAERFTIAVGVAEALEYLHIGGSNQPVIHRDVKSSNILLSDGFEPQLSDFGLAQWATSSPQNSENIASNDLAGTFGYLAPEYFMDGKIDEKIDIYAFGVVLLELLSGRKPVCSSCPKGEESLVLWAKPILLGGKFDQLVDPLLDNNYDSDEMERMCLAATLCTRQASHSRPSSDLVVKLLQGDSEAVECARLHLSTSSESEGLDDEAGSANSIIQSHINLALLDIEDDALSTSSIDQSVNFITANTSLEDYLKTRCSRSSSFN